MNNCVFEGNLTRNPEVNALASGTTVVNFGLAVDSEYVQNGELKKNTSFLDFKAFGWAADAVANLSKGDRILVRAEAQVESWEKEGKKFYKTVFKANTVGVVKAGGQGKAARQPAAAAAGNAGGGESDAPF
jgi:single-strand DNA-binding protein